MNATLCGAITFVGFLIAFAGGLLFAVADSQFAFLSKFCGLMNATMCEAITFVGV